MRLSPVSLIFLSAAILAFVSPLRAAAPPPAATPARTAPAQIRLEMRLVRIDKPGVPASESGNGDAKTSAAPAPPAIATPILSTLDRGTATVVLTNKDLSYSVSASPSLEQPEKSGSTVQVLWNIRLSGRALPDGTNAVTTTGATRILPESENETLLTELPISDAKTGNISVFRLTVRVVVTRATAAGPEAGPVPPSTPPTP